jgi:hypothetical protein
MERTRCWGRVLILGEGVADGLGRVVTGQVEEHDVAGGTLDQGPDRGPAGLADDEVTLPVAGNGPVGHLGGTFGDHHHVGDPAPVVEAGALAANGPAGPQAQGEFFA